MAAATEVGLASLPKQVENKLLKRGFNFNLMVVGRAGLGKSTMVNTLFGSHIIESKGVSTKQTTEISSVSSVIEESGVRLKLSITDTPGFGDQINNEDCIEPIIKHIKDQYSLYLRRELTPQREQKIPDTRIHAVLYFIAPSGHSLSPLDIGAMKKIAKSANIVPLIAKSDSLTPSELKSFKLRIKSEIEFHGIRIYPFVDFEDEFNIPGSEQDKVNKEAFALLKSQIPFAVVGSERNIVVGGKAVRGRRSRSGVINVEDESHCEFSQMRNFLIKTHLYDLMETTSMIHYETFRTRQLLALKESTTKATAS